MTGPRPRMFSLRVTTDDNGLWWEILQWRILDAIDIREWPDHAAEIYVLDETDREKARGFRRVVVKPWVGADG